MHGLVGVASAAFIVFVLVEGFETIVLPRRVTRRLRFARLYFRLLWLFWASFAAKAHDSSRREGLLSVYGPASLLGLLGLWAVALILGFAGLQWAIGSHIVASDGATPTFWTDLYLSGTTFFTLGLGDVAPRSAGARTLTVIESGTGFAFLALAVSYLPVLYQAFTQRETSISLLDARAGSPPHAAGLLAGCQGRFGVEQLLRDWERWAAELLESHLSYPVLAFYRSQHVEQNWLGALTAILDTCSIVLASEIADLNPQAGMTFRMSLHALLDLRHILVSEGPVHFADRLPGEVLEELLRRLPAGYLADAAAIERLEQLRREYEPAAAELSGCS